jgi:hydrogenase nickel incorporation protein HypA/HybF
MHETALVRDIVHRIEELARAAGARRVTGVKICLGALSHLSAEHFREHFVIEARDTLAAEAALEIVVSDDPRAPHAQQVRLESVDVESDT